METKTKQLFISILYGVLILVFAFVVFKLFFGNVFDEFVEEDELRTTDEVLHVVYPDFPPFLTPISTMPVVRQRLINTYDTFVRADNDMNIEPSLALNWGMIDDRTWEFKLRSNVILHDGSEFDSGDAVFSIDLARGYEGSDLVGLLSTIESVSANDYETLIIKTFEPDPLLLQRLSMVFGVSSGLEGGDVIGTGPYVFDGIDPETGIISLSRFDDYWGESARFAGAQLYGVPDKSQRISMLISGDADFVTFVPYDGVSILKENGIETYSISSLEVQFLIFNFDSKIMSDYRAREMISLLVDQNDLIEMVGGFAREVSQFVSAGVFGYSPVIADHSADLEKAKELANELKLKGKIIKLHLPVGLTVLGEYMRERMSEIGLNLIVSYLEIPDFIKSLQSGDADIYFLGFRSELGDSSDFLQSIVHSDGDSNFGNYSNEYVDNLIDQGSISLDVVGRRGSLQDAMEQVVSNDIVGVPLFEYETVFGFDGEKFSYNPRIDGFIYFDDIYLK